MLKIKSAFSLIEALVAIFVLSMITLTYMNSSSVFIRQQADLINKDRLNQIADLIIQDIMAYSKLTQNPYGSIVADAQNFGGADNTLEVSNVTSMPQAGDIFIIADQANRYTVQSTSGSTPDSVVITTIEDLPSNTTITQSSLTFISFKKNDLSCFDGLNLANADAPASLTNCSSLPDDISDLFDHWKNIIDTEFGSELTTRTIVLDDQDLIKVTLGDGTENITIAKKINNCLSDAPTQTIAFSFPGIADPIETGIMSGPENPVAHYAYDGRAYNFANPNSDMSATQNTPISCTRVPFSTCRQSYAWENTITVFLYRYTGTTPIRVRATTLGGWKGQGTLINPNDISLWFIFGEYNSSNAQDISNLGQTLAGRTYGYLRYNIRNLPDVARVLTFNTSSEGCADNVDDGDCDAKHSFGGNHAGNLFHLGSNASTFSNIELTLTGNPSPFSLDAWRILKNEPNCLIASGQTGSAHGSALNIEDKNTCWNYVTATTDSLAQALTKNQMTMRLNDSSKFPSSGSLQVGSEYINYSSNNTATNTITISTRGVRPTGTLTETIPNSGMGGDWKIQEISNGKLLTGTWGGYLEINDEIFESHQNYSNHDWIDNNTFRISNRGMRGSSEEGHNVGDQVRNYDMRAQTWPSGTIVYEGPPNSVPVVMQKVGSGNNRHFPRKRLKKKIKLNVTLNSVCS